MRKAIVALALWLAPLVAMAAEERPKPPPGGEGREPEAEQKIKEALQKKVTFDFVETPLGDVANFLQALVNVNLILAPGVDRDQKVTLRVNEMALAQALQWVARMAGARMDVRDGAVVIERDPGPPGRPVPGGPRPPGGPFGKATLSLGPGLSIEMELDEEDLRPEVRALLLFLIHRQIAAEAQKYDPKAIQEFMEGMAKRRQMEAEMRQHMQQELRKAEAAQRAAMMEAEARRRAEEEARKQRERREKPEGGEKKGQF